MLPVSPSAAKVDRTASQFRLLLWLKLRLMLGNLQRSTSARVAKVLMLVTLLPISIWLSTYIYHFAIESPSMLPALLTDSITVIYLFWFITPLIGFSVNESYDPTKLFLYPVSYQIIFGANVVGSLIEVSTLISLPILFALLLAASSGPVSLIVDILLLLAFLLQTIALGQAVTLVLLGFLRSRKFRDLVIVIFPLIAALRYYLQTNMQQGMDINQMLLSPYWRIADYFPPGWTAIAMCAVRESNWGQAALGVFGVIASLAVTVSVAAFVLHQLFIGERGPALPAAKTTVSAARQRPKVEKSGRQLSGAWVPITALAQKELRYLVRDPQYKALAANFVYMVALIGFSVFRGAALASGLLSGENPISSVILAAMPLFANWIVLFSTTSLIFNIFGGEGPAITMLFSFPTPRKYFAFGKNLAHGLLIFVLGVIATFGMSFITSKSFNFPLSVLGSLMLTLVAVGAGNLISVFLPTRFVIRGSRLSRGGQVSVGASRDPSDGCMYAFFDLLCWLGVMVATIPAALSVIAPEAGWVPTYWCLATIPVGIAYSVGVYVFSIYLFDSWIDEKEQKIIASLAPSD